MNQNIRKISVGTGHPDNMMHYQIGKEFNLMGNYYTLTDIILDREMLQIGKLCYNLYVKDTKNGGKVLWKQLIDVPTVIEHNITFS